MAPKKQTASSGYGDAPSDGQQPDQNYLELMMAQLSLETFAGDVAASSTDDLKTGSFLLFLPKPRRERCNDGRQHHPERQTFDVEARGSSTIGDLRRLIALTYQNLGYGKITKKQILLMTLVLNQEELHTRPRATLRKMKLATGCNLQASIGAPAPSSQGDEEPEEDDDFVDDDVSDDED
eukprot:s148_g19.t1